MSSSDLDFSYGRTTEQINGILTLKKQSSPDKKGKQGIRHGYLSWNSTSPQKTNKRVKSQLMRSILERDWQKVLIRARLVPREIHEFTVLEVPVPISCDPNEVGVDRKKKNRATRVKFDDQRLFSYCRVKVLPVHAACALRPPPEVVRALLSHAVASAFSNDGVVRSYGPKKVPGKPTRGDSFQHLSGPTPLYHEQNTSFAAVAVERVEESTFGKAMVKKIHKIGGMVRKVSKREKNRSKPGLLRASTDEEDSNTNNAEETGLNNRDIPGHSKNKEDVALFLKQMEDCLAHNGRCQSVFRDTNPCPKLPKSSQSHQKSSPSRFVLDIDPAVLIPSPSTVRVIKKRQNVIGLNNRDNDLVSLENSVGDSDTAMTTSTHRLVARDESNGEESSGLDFLTDDSSSHSSASSSLLAPPSSDSDDCDDGSNDSNSFLQLTADGKLSLVELEEDSNGVIKGERSDVHHSKKNCDVLIDESLVLRGHSQAPASSIASATANGSRESDISSSASNFSKSRSTFVPEDIRLDHFALLQSLPRSVNNKNGKSNNEGVQNASVYGISRLLPLHIACLYGASSSVLKILLEEYPRGSSVEVLGMLPVHMVAANWSLVATEKSPGFDSDGNYSVEGFDLEKNRIAALVVCSPGSLFKNSSMHGLRPLEYTRNLLLYPSNTSDEGMIRVRNYLLDSEESTRNVGLNGHGHTNNVRKMNERAENDTKEPSLKEKDNELYFNPIIQTTSTCTTSGLSSAWLANDSSSVYSSSVSTAPAPNASQLSLGALLCQSRWKDARELLKENPEKARERCFSRNSGNYVSGNDVSFSSESSSGLKEQLPIHIVCQMLKKGTSVPLDLVKLIVSAYPEGLAETDDETISGSLPLHLICDSFHRRKRDYQDHNIFVSELLQVLELLLSKHINGTQNVDNRGRLPLHRAVHAAAPLEAIQLLVYCYPKAATSPDRDGMTPRRLSTSVYAFGSPVDFLFRRLGS